MARAALLLLALAVPGCVGWSISREFFAGTPGTAPESIVVVSGSWQVAQAEGLAEGMPALAQVAGGAATAGICLLRETTVEDGALQVRLRTRRDAPAAGGGVVWGADDGATRYRFAELDAAAGRVRVVEVVGGAPREVASAAVACADGWRTLRVDFSGDDVAVQLDGATCLECELDGAEGGIGLYSPPQATSLFADFAVIARR